MNKLMLIALLVAGCGGSEAPKTEAPAPEAPKVEAPAAPAAPVAAAGPVDGKAIYESTCQTCHQADGMGMLNGVALGGNYKERLVKPDEELFNSIKNGKTGEVGTMPAWGGTLNDEQIHAVLAYVRATYGGAAPAAGGTATP